MLERWPIVEDYPRDRESDWAAWDRKKKTWWVLRTPEDRALAHLLGYKVCHIHFEGSTYHWEECNGDH